jgi:polyhydroxybutyrate depolymerase
LQRQDGGPDRLSRGNAGGGLAVGARIWSLITVAVLLVGGAIVSGLLFANHEAANASPSEPVAGITCTRPWVAGDSVNTIDSAGGSRSYRLHVPPSYSAAGSMALVFDFHGYGQNAQQEEQYTGLTTIADREGFIVVTPEGSSSPKGWNVVGVYAEDGVDDVQFVRDLLASLSTVLCVDPNRVYATGHSNGAEMASQLACVASDVIVAAAPVSGVVWQACAGTPVPIVAFQGTADLTVRYEWSAPTITQWANHNGCKTPPISTPVADHVTAETWQDCAADTVFYVIDGGGHTWPGSTASGGTGPVTTAINASELIWAFFAAHPRQ